MIDQLEIEKYLNENFDVEYVNTPCFMRYETIKNEIYERPCAIKSYLFRGIERFKLDKMGLKKLYVYKDFAGNILFQYNGNNLVRIRMYSVYANKRYKLKTKKHV